jgi:V8-like Glu-specific endopeptidase
MARKKPAYTPAAHRAGKVPGSRSGARGTGETVPQPRVAEAAPAAATEAASGRLDPSTAAVGPQEHGSASNHPYTTSRVDLRGATLSKAYPYSAVGKIYYKDGLDTFVCSASLIGRGVIVTAAHCVAAFGEDRFFSGWQFVPGLSGKKKPYGVWNVLTAWVKSSYLDGTDSCSEPGIVCENDVAILIVKPKGKVYPGKKTGYLGFGWDGFGFTPTGLVLVNQLGYPTSHDDGLLMQRTDSQGFVSAADSGNTVWGSRQTGGSSGGPEVLNLGAEPLLTEGIVFGDSSDYNMVIGVTSWGYTDDVTKEQGASPFTADNVLSLVNDACAAAPAACLE